MIWNRWDTKKQQQKPCTYDLDLANVQPPKRWCSETGNTVRKHRRSDVIFTICSGVLLLVCSTKHMRFHVYVIWWYNQKHQMHKWNFVFKILAALSITNLTIDRTYESHARLTLGIRAHLHLYTEHDVNIIWCEFYKITSVDDIVYFILK